MTAEHGKETLTFRDGQDALRIAQHFQGMGAVKSVPGPRADHRPDYAGGTEKELS